MRSNEDGLERVAQIGRRPKTIAAERMAELRVRAADPERRAKREDGQRAIEAETERFMQDEVAGFSLGAPGMPSHGIERILENVANNAPSFRLDPRPRGAWELAKSYDSVLADDDELCDRVFMNRCEAFNVGVLLGQELARHESEHAPAEAGAANASEPSDAEGRSDNDAL